MAPPLAADGKTLSTAPHRLGYLKPTDPDIGIKAVRDIYEEHGYVWLKHFLPRTDVVEFRGWVISHLADTGLIELGLDPVLGIASAGALDKKLADRRLMSIVRSTAYEGFCAQPRLARFMDEFLGGLSYLHKRKIMRFTLPGTSTATPAHYDLVYLRGGTNRIATAWIPIGDIPVAMGGLTYLEARTGSGARWRRLSRRLAPNSAPENEAVRSIAT